MGAKNEMEELFLRRKPVRLLLNIKVGGTPKYVSVLAKDTDCTYSHTVKILQEMEKAGLVSFEKQGRIKTIKLTDNGLKIADHIGRIKDLL